MLVWVLKLDRLAMWQQGDLSAGIASQPPIEASSIPVQSACWAFSCDASADRLLR